MMGLLVILFIVLLGIAWVIESKPSKEESNNKIDTVKIYMNKHNVPLNVKLIKYKSGIKEFDLNISRCTDSRKELQEYYFWYENERITVLSKHNITGEMYVQNKKVLDVKKINYFTIQGDRYVTTDVQGGGSSLGKAVIGGAIAGGAGAVIASRQKIKSTTNVVDERNTMISYNDNGVNINIVLSSQAYECLLNWIPNKEQQFIERSEIKSTNSNSIEKHESLSSIQELVKLKEMGMLDDEEFKLMKKKILDL